jgi:hypothetical protein
MKQFFDLLIKNNVINNEGYDSFNEGYDSYEVSDQFVVTYEGVFIDEISLDGIDESGFRVITAGGSDTWIEAEDFDAKDFKVYKQIRIPPVNPRAVDELDYPRAWEWYV